ncbi:MAG: exodeoxyribonuclease VII small subunit [Oscillospiraceae bacterium]|nr:exodeoxyribonuclease VII small subunit [Oscillospiraceae bacterium]
MTMTFEKSISRLDEIIELLSSGDTTLDQSLKLYAEGAKLIGSCQNQLDNAQLKIEQLSAVKEGIADEL